MEIFLNPEQRVGSRRADYELRTAAGSENSNKRPGGPLNPHLRIGQDRSQAHNARAMAVFGAFSFDPAAIVAQKVLEPCARRIERVFQERHISRRQVRSR